MLENAKTRIILKSKIVSHVAKFSIIYNYKEIHPKAIIELIDGSIINTKLISLEHVKDKDSDGKDADWVQYICID